MKKRLVALALTSAIIFGLVGCGSGSTSNSSTSSTSTDTSSQSTTSSSESGDSDDEDAIKIGFLTPLSGDTATYGKQVKCAGDMIVDLVNNARPEMHMALAKDAGLPNLNNKKIKIVVADTKGDPSTAASEAKRLITEEGVVAMTGQYTSAITKAVAVVTENYGIPLVTAGSSPSLTSSDTNFQWYFRFCPNDTTFIEDSFDYLDELNKQGYNLKTVGFACEDTEFGTYIRREMERISGEHGYDVACDIQYSASATNVSAEVMKIKEANPDVLMMSSYSSDAILYFKTFKEQNWCPKMLLGQRGGFIQTDFLNTMGENTENIFTTAGWSSDIQTDTVKELVEEYKKYTPDGSELSEGHTKDMTDLLMICIAMNQAGSSEPEKVREAIKNLDIDTTTLPIPWPGIKFDEYGQNIEANGFIVQMRDQKYQTVYPGDYAAIEPKLPMTGWGKQ